MVRYYSNSNYKKVREFMNMVGFDPDFLFTADAETERPFKWTALHCAAYVGRPAAIEMMMEAGANVDVRDNLHENTPLMWAVSKSRYASAIMLLDKYGADVSLRNRLGQTAWDLVVEDKTKKWTKILKRDDYSGRRASHRVEHQENVLRSVLRSAWETLFQCEDD
jgi:ankyrin repeat protein